MGSYVVPYVGIYNRDVLTLSTAKKIKSNAQKAK